MHVYDTLIIGCGYSSVGYAAFEKNCIICEEGQMCDTHFYLPLRSFKYLPYEPETDQGKRLLDVFTDLSLFKGEMQNTNGFECALCKYLADEHQEVLLKCRVLNVEKNNDIFDVTIQTNQGLSHLYAKKVLNTLGIAASKRFTVLFTTDDIAAATAALSQAFEGSFIESAFYDNRYAIHICADGYDENTVKLYVYNKWHRLDIDAKVVYMAPAFSHECERVGLCDDMYENPIQAFEAGYFYAKESAK